MPMRLTETDRRVLEAFTAKDGVSTIPLAMIWLRENRGFEIPKKTLYNSVSKLRSMNYLRLLPGDRSPALYEPGVMYYREKERTSAKRTVVGTKGNPIPSQGDPHPIYPAPYSLDGVVSAKECPDGYGAYHLSGSMSLTVEKVGSFEDPKVGNSWVGHWKPEHPSPGAINRSGVIDIDYQEITFNYRHGIRKDTHTFTLRPARIFVDPSKYQTFEQVRRVFFARAMKVASILARYGWKLTNPVLDGNSDVEVASPNSPLVHVIPQGQTVPGADLFVDGSPGCPEVEMRHIDDFEKVDIMVKAPTHILEAKRNAAAAREDSHRANERIDEVMDLMDRIITVQERTSQAVQNNAENIAKLVQSDSELTALILSQQARSVYAPMENMDGRTRKLEGYQ
jgi:hypothetical protein